MNTTKRLLSAFQVRKLYIYEREREREIERERERERESAHTHRGTPRVCLYAAIVCVCV